ncbi:MAG: ABC transporter substrate-binding protein [Methylophilaceae bacterium]|nr:ABC transporter substrate-binding protein [Methylophilaceae bacterium]
MRNRPQAMAGGPSTVTKRHALFLLLPLLLLSLLLVTCSTHTSPLRIGTSVWPGYEPLYLARELDLLPPNTAQLVEYTSASQVMEALRGGAIEAATLTLNEALLLQDEGIKVHIVLVMDASHGADMLLARPDIDSLRALKGHRIGVEDTALGAYMLDRALTVAGLAPEEVQVVPAAFHEHENLFRSGKVDAVVTFEPVASRLLHGGAHKLFDSAQIPGEIVDVLVVREGFFSHQIMQLRNVLRAWFGALQYMHQNPTDAARRMMPRLEMSGDQVQAALERIRFPDAAQNRALLRGNPILLEQQAARLARVMTAHRLATDLHPAVLFEEVLLETLHP